MADENSGSSSDSSGSVGGSFGGGSDPNATGGGSFGGGSYSPGQGMGGQYSMAGTLGTLNTPTVNTGSASVSVFGGTPAGPQFGSGLGGANTSGLSFNPSALGASPSSFGPNSGALDSSQFSQEDPNKPSTGLSPVSTGSVPTMGFLGNTPFSQQTMGLSPGSLNNGTMLNPGEMNNNDASVPGSIGNSIPDASRFVPMAPVGPSPSQAGNVLSWSQEPASTQNAQAASFMPPGLGYASLNSPSAPPSSNDPFGGTSLSPLNAGYSVLTTPQERDMAIRTIASEADPSTQGYAAVAGVIANRAALNGQRDPLTGMTYPGSVGGVVSQPSQFSGYNDKNYHGIDPNSDRYQHIGSVLDSVLSGNTPDPTGGATAYYAPSGMPHGLAPSWAKDLPPGQTIGTQVFFGGTPSQLASQAASVQPNNTPSSPYGGLYNPAPQLASVNSMPAGLGYSTYAGTPTSGNAINIGPGGTQAGQQSLGTVASPWGTGTSEDAMNFAMARGPAGLAANMITPPNNNVLSWTAVPPTHSSIPQGDASSAAQYSPIRNPDGTGVYPHGGIDAPVPLSADAPRPNPALAAYDNGMLFNPNYGENNSGVLGQWGVPGSIKSQDQSVYSPESPMFNRPYVAAYSPSLLGAPPSTSTAAALAAPTGVSPPAAATIASPAERPALTVPSQPTTARSQEKSAATSYDLHPVDYNPFPNSPTNLQGSAFLDAPTGQVGKAFNYLAAHGGTYSPSGGSTGKSYSPATPPIIPPPTTDNGTAASAAAPAPQGWSKDSNGIWNFGPMPSGYVSPFPASAPASQGFAGGGGVSFVSNNDPMADPEESAKDDAYIPDQPSAPPAEDSYSLHPVPYDPFQTQPPPAETPESFLTWQRQRQAARDFEPPQVSAVNDPEYNKGLSGLRQTLIDQPVGAAADFVTAPGRIMSGELAENDPDFANSAIQGATMLAGRGLAAPGEGYGIFGGVGSKSAPMNNFKSAILKEQAGATPTQIWQDTGWMRELSSDKMMFEIPNQGSALKPITYDKVDQPITIGDIFSHPELEKHYPGIMDTPARVRTDLPPNIMGGYNPDGSLELNAFMPKSKMRYTLLHELNHLVQEKEGFSSGYNPDAPAAHAFAQSLNQIPTQALSTSAPSISPGWGSVEPGSVTNWDVYKRMEGEDKSRITSVRADMTDEERQERPPWMDTDLPPGTPRYGAQSVHDWYYGNGKFPASLTPQYSAGPLHAETVRGLTESNPVGEDPTRGLADAQTGSQSRPRLERNDDVTNGSGTEGYIAHLPDGRRIITEIRRSGDTARILDMHGEYDLQAKKTIPSKNEIGNSDIRSILREFLKQNPGIKNITGDRVTGARESRPSLERETSVKRPNGFAKGGAVKKRNKDEFDWNIPLNKQSESVQRLVRARLET